MSLKVLDVIAGDELFLNFGNTVVYNYDQNRAIAGFGYKPTDNLLINLTYVYQYAQKNSAYNFEHSDLLWLRIAQTINFREKKKRKIDVYFKASTKINFNPALNNTTNKQYIITR